MVGLPSFVLQGYITFEFFEGDWRGLHPYNNAKIIIKKVFYKKKSTTVKEAVGWSLN